MSMATADRESLRVLSDDRRFNPPERPTFRPEREEPQPQSGDAMKRFLASCELESLVVGFAELMDGAGSVQNREAEMYDFGRRVWAAMKEQKVV